MPHYVYILASLRGVLYTGSTNNLTRRIDQHRASAHSSFAQRYNVTKLVYTEVADSSEAAFSRERQIKGWKRDKKVALIESQNPYWQDLAKVGLLQAEV